MPLLTELNMAFTRRVPLLLQTEAAECGLACLAMIASYHGLRSDLATLRTQHQISLKGISLKTLIGIATKLSLNTRPIRLELTELQDLQLPCILHWDMNHFVVLTAINAKGATIHDPAFGTRQLSMSEVSGHFTGIALELSPSADFKPKKEVQQVRLASLIGAISGLKRSLSQIFILAIALEVFALLSPLFIQVVTDSVLLSSDKDLLVVLVLGFVLLQLVQQATIAMRSWVVMHMSVTMNLQWVSNIFMHLLRLPVSYFEKRHVGDVVSRFGSVGNIQRTLTGSFLEAVVDGIMAICALALMLAYSPLLTAIVAVAVLAYAVLRWVWYAPLHDATEEQIAHAANQQTHFLETVRGVRSIKLFERLEERRASWVNLMVCQTNAEIRTQKLNIAYRGLHGLLFGMLSIIIVWLAASLILDKKLTTGMMFAFLAYQRQFTDRVGSLIDKMVDLVMLKLYIGRLADIVLTAPEHQGDLNQAEALQEDCSLHVRNLRFRYGDDEPMIIDGLDLDIAEGEAIAIVGASGCGKTTLLKLLLGIHTPIEGEICIGKASLKKLGAASFRSIIGTVMQDDHLFAGTIAENICFFDREPDHAWIQECAAAAAIHDDIMAMPMAYQTLMGDMGTAISGGQQQRILLARALYKRPKILFLDEATSHLDIQREQAVNMAIKALKVTRIIVAHRPETIAMADRVVTLHAGKIVKDSQAGVMLSVAS